MKLILATLIALSTTSAFAGSEVVYLKPFKKQTEVFKHDNVSSLEIWNARIADVPTTVERDYSRCQFEDSFACPKTTVLETTKAVQVDISYFTSHDDGGVQEQLFLDPKELSSATIALLQGKKALGGKARKVFALKTESILKNVKSVDERLSTICDSDAGPSCKDILVYKDVVVQKTVISIVPRQ